MTDAIGVFRTAEVDAPTLAAAERVARAWLAREGEKITTRTADGFELASGGAATIAPASDRLPVAPARAVRVRSKFDSSAVRARTLPAA